MRRSITGFGLIWFARAFYLLFALIPIYWLVKISLTPTKLLFREGIRYFPSTITFDNFNTVLKISPFPKYFLNSLIVSLGTAIIIVVVGGGIGYALSRFKFVGKSLVVTFLLVTQLFPIVMMIAPIYRLMAPLHLIDNLVGLIIVYTAFITPFAAFLLQSFFDSIPRELEESAMIDGATRLQALRKIVFPLVLPGLGATIGFVFTVAWSELLLALMLINSEGSKTFAVGLLAFVTRFGVDWGQMTAAATIALVPVCIFFAFIQRYLVQGLTAGALKE